MGCLLGEGWRVGHLEHQSAAEAKPHAVRIAAVSLPYNLPSPPCVPSRAPPHPSGGRSRHRTRKLAFLESNAQASGRCNTNAWPTSLITTACPSSMASDRGSSLLAHGLGMKPCGSGPLHVEFLNTVTATHRSSHWALPPPPPPTRMEQHHGSALRGREPRAHQNVQTEA